MFTKQTEYEISLSACQLKHGVSILVSGLHINLKLWLLKNEECKSLKPGDNLRFAWSGLVRSLNRFITIYTCALMELRLFGKHVTFLLPPTRTQKSTNCVKFFLKILYLNAKFFETDAFKYRQTENKRIVLIKSRISLNYLKMLLFSKATFSLSSFVT